MLILTMDGQEHTVPTVEELKALGFRVYVTHLRRAFWTDYPDTGSRRERREAPLQRTRRSSRWRYSPRGGATRVLLLAPNGQWAEATVKCSDKDAYVKRVGYTLAVERAIDALPYSARRKLDDLMPMKTLGDRIAGS